MNHFIEITDFTTEEILCVLDRADELRKSWQSNTMPQSLSGEKIALWFFGKGLSQEKLVKKIKDVLGLPVVSSKAIPEGIIDRFEKWHTASNA
jgi:aspartate carbamoyltransferase catalytic subunit